MTSTPARGADPDRGAPGRPLRALSVTPALLILLLGGLLLRLAIAYVLFPSSGFASDIGTYVSWALTLADHGASGFYANVSFIDYPPGYLLILWPIGLLGQALAPMAGGDSAAAVQSLIKLPPIFLDLVVAFVLYRLVKGWAAPRGWRRAESMALAAAAIYLFNPVTWYDSSLWGQTDAAGALVMLIGVAALIRGNTEGACAMAVVAAMVKPQYGIVMIPLVFVVLIKRHWFDVGSAPDHRPLIGGRVGDWLTNTQGPVRLATGFLVAWATFFAIALPFAMGPYEYLKVVFGSVGGYSYLSVNAYNPWALLGAGGTQPLAESGSWSSDIVAFLGPIPAVVIGGGLLLIGFVLTLVRVFLRPTRSTILVGIVVLSAAFFVLPTRVHERYLFPVFAFLPILAVFSRRWRLATLAFTIGSFMNLHAILTYNTPGLKYGTPNVQDLIFGDLFRTFPFVAASVLLQTAAFAFAAWQLRPSAVDEHLEALDQLDDVGEADELEPGITAPGAHEAGWSPDPVPGMGARAALQPSLALAAAGATNATLMGPAGTADPGTASAPVGWVDPDGGGWNGQSGVTAWINARLGTLHPARRDRSPDLASERFGRWDRLDLLVVVILTVGSFTLRAFNLAQPYDMYFDEVYHARTAIEFLQDWRYGIVHDIYEFTHPHLAKYAMAYGIEAFADNAVTGTTTLPQSVVDAVIEPRWSPDAAPDQRDGDRMYVLDGSHVGVYDLATRAQIAQIPLEQPATALGLDPDTHVLYVAAGTAISEIDTTALDALRANSATTIPPPASFAALTGITGTIRQLTVADESLIARTDAGWLAAVDLADGTQTGSGEVKGAVDALGIQATDQLVADQTAITDPAAEATILANDLADSVSRIRPLLTGTDTRVSIAGYLSETDRKALNTHLNDGSLPGISIASGPVVAVSGTKGVTFLDAIGLRSLMDLPLGGAQGMAYVSHDLDSPTIYVAVQGATGPSLQTIAIQDPAPALGTSLRMPGPVHDVVWNESADLIHVVGERSDGTPTIYVVEPHGNSVFADAALPFEPNVVLADTQPDRPQSDRMQLIALAGDGNLATVDIGQNAFAWRLPGVVMGSITIVCLFLLARLLFRRRSVALITALLVMAGGMFFANARIAMNDTYVTGFMMAAVTLFTPLYLGIWRRRWQVVAGLLGVGLLLGLALASKWVGAYTMGGLVLLVLLRSALGRLLALGGMIAMTAVLGALAVLPADVPQPHINVLFPILMLVLTAALAITMVRRPVRMTLDELSFAVVAPAVAGVLLVALTLVLGPKLPKDGWFSSSRLTLVAAGFLVSGALFYAVAWLSGRILHRGPLAAPRPVRDDEPVPSAAPSGWLRAGHAAGIPWLFALTCLAVVPLVVYAISYIPWYNLGNQLIEGIPAGHQGGNTLWNLTIQMYNYHNGLTAGHPASSPWWAWLLDLKPVWFYQHGFADNTTGVIYDAENLVLTWLAIPAMAFTAWAAWHRRSLALTVIVVMFLAMWLPWSRIDRATFQYHVLTSLPFAALALAYFLAELWHGPSPGAWLLARVAAAVAIIGAPLLWLVREPLCLVAGSAAAHAAEGATDGIACGTITRSTDVSQAALASAAVLVGGMLVLGWQLWLLYRAGGAAAGPIRLGRVSVPAEAAPFATLLAILAAVVLAVRIFSPERAFTLSIGADEIALIGLAALAVPAWLVLHAHDARRFVIGVLTAAVLWFVAWYPNLSGLPMPNSIANIYQGLLPSWNYDFWFAVHKDPLATGSITGLTVAILAIALLVVVVAILVTHWLRPERPIASVSEGEMPDPA